MANDNVVSLDDEVESAVLKVIREAKRSVTIVSPYLKLWTRAQQAIEQALKRRVDITFYVRNEEKQTTGESVTWLTGHGAKVYAVDFLHSKIYLNETTTLISSMNMLDTSVEKSMEIAMLVQDHNDAQRIRDYVVERLRPLARPVSTGGQADTSLSGQSRQAPLQVTKGFCIRCGNVVALDPSKPLCDACYDSWAEWKNEDYPENVCHACGRRAKVTHARPLCESCYLALR